MFVILPYATDAPIYHRPIGTIAVIAANVLVFLAVGGGPVDGTIHLWLAWGKGLQPLQWLTSNFVHGDWLHLAGNMVFLWVFGLVVEGKLGWWRFLACYLGIGVSQSAIEQVLALGYTGPAVVSGGASSAIFGLLAMAMVWAPLNEITCLSFGWIAGVIRTGTFEMGIGLWGVLFVGLNAVEAFFGSWTAVLHLGGAAIGAPVAIALLRGGLVDCEGWDVFSVIRNDRPTHFGELEKQREQLREIALIREREAQDRAAKREEFRHLLAAGDVVAALAVRRSVAGFDGGFPIERDELFSLATGLRERRCWAEAAEVMEECLSQYPFGTDATRISLAHLYAAWLDRPQRAIELVEAIDPEMLAPADVALADRIARKARAMIAKGTTSA